MYHTALRSSIMVIIRKTTFKRVSDSKIGAHCALHSGNLWQFDQFLDELISSSLICMYHVH